MTEGMKFDNDKSRVDLIQPNFILELGKVLGHGAKKYEDNNWMKVDKGKDRYYGALIRHLMDYRKGIRVDSESGLKTLSHAMANLHFLLYFDEQEMKVKNNGTIS